MSGVSFSGIASGIDSEALIGATTDALRSQRVEPQEERRTKLQETNSTITELKSKISALRTAVEVFATINGGGIAKLGSSSDESVASATVGNGATNGTYQLTVTQLARNGIHSFGNSGGYASTTSLIGGTAGTVAITVGTASAVNISVSGTTTLQSFVDQFNAASSNAEASLVNVGTSSSPNYRVVITSDKTGTTDGTISINFGTTTAFDQSSTSTARNSIFTLGGVGTITRATNDVSDVISGVTFSLRNTGTATITVGEDTATTQSRLQDFIDAYNEVVNYVRKNNQVTRDESTKEATNVFGSLSTTRVDDNFLSAIRKNISGVRNTSGAVRILADLGIESQRDGTLALDAEAFKSGLASDPAGASTLLTSFADTVGTTNGTINQYIRFNGLFDTVLNANNEQVTRINTQIQEAEGFIASQAEAMKARFARLEKVIGEMQQRQQSLSSALSGLGR